MMGFLQALTFTTPLALAGLLLLPVIWWLLRFTPPKPQIVRFPPLRLLLDLVTAQEQPDKTPWWLMLLRLAIAALVILGVSHPLLCAGPCRRAWAVSRSCSSSTTAGPPPSIGTSARRSLPKFSTNARRAGAHRDACHHGPRGATGGPRAARRRGRRAARPQPSSPRRSIPTAWPPGASEASLWHAAGAPHRVDRRWPRSRRGHRTLPKDSLALANGSAPVEAVMPDAAALPMALATPTIDGGRIKITALRAIAGQAGRCEGPRLAGNGRSLADAALTFAAGSGKAEGDPRAAVELRNEVAAHRDRGRTQCRRDVPLRRPLAAQDRGLQSGTALEAAQPLLSPLYYVSRALEPYAEIAEPADAAALKEQARCRASPCWCWPISASCRSETAQMLVSRGWSAAACCCASPAPAWPAPRTNSFRSRCARAAARSAAP